jgi:hypothetical protein
MRSKCANSISALNPAPGIGQHPIRLEEPDRPAGAPFCREVSEDFANDTGELEAVARAWRRQDNLRPLRVQPENEVLVGAACVDAETRAVNFTRGSRDIALQDRTQARLLVVGDFRPRLIRGCKIPAAQMRWGESPANSSRKC